MDDKDSVIEALKASNDGRQLLIDDLLFEIQQKDQEIKRLKRRVKSLEYLINGIIFPEKG